MLMSRAYRKLHDSRIVGGDKSARKLLQAEFSHLPLPQRSTFVGDQLKSILEIYTSKIRHHQAGDEILSTMGRRLRQHIELISELYCRGLNLNEDTMNIFEVGDVVAYAEDLYACGLDRDCDSRKYENVYVGSGLPAGVKFKVISVDGQHIQISPSGSVRSLPLTVGQKHHIPKGWQTSTCLWPANLFVLLEGGTTPNGAAAATITRANMKETNI